ncbi:ATP-binding protein [Streptomyces sp. NBC_01803]|nr:ATP-binding protein [Streptomyces sp. NBC_01803]WSA43677.1 ATP-binding protein [Streptomyces sp. NBC_01803]
MCVQEALVAWGLTGVVDEVLLLCSELVTNAVVHGAAERIWACLTYGGGVLLLAVDDGSPGRAYVREAGPEAESGRGMAIVEALSAGWGTDGPRTWCTVTVPEGGGER